jgi:hypothetical protein
MKRRFTYGVAAFGASAALAVAGCGGQNPASKVEHGQVEQAVMHPPVGGIPIGPLPPGAPLDVKPVSASCRQVGATVAHLRHYNCSLNMQGYDAPPYQVQAVLADNGTVTVDWDHGHFSDFRVY